MKSTKAVLLSLLCLAICGVAESDDAPYPRSPVITGIRFDESTLTKAAPGSDQFGYTTASDGNLYVAWGDGGGFGGTNNSLWKSADLGMTWQKVGQTVRHIGDRGDQFNLVKAVLTLGSTQ